MGSTVCGERVLLLQPSMVPVSLVARQVECQIFSVFAGEITAVVFQESYFQELMDMQPILTLPLRVSGSTFVTSNVYEE